MRIARTTESYQGKLPEEAGLTGDEGMARAMIADLSASNDWAVSRSCRLLRPRSLKKIEYLKDLGRYRGGIAAFHLKD